MSMSMSKLTTFAFDSSSEPAPNGVIIMSLVDDGKLPCLLTRSTHMPICSPLSTDGRSPLSSAIKSRALSVFGEAALALTSVLATSFGIIGVGVASTRCRVDLRMGSLMGSLDAMEGGGDGALASLIAAGDSDGGVGFGFDLAGKGGWPMSGSAELVELSRRLV